MNNRIPLGSLNKPDGVTWFTLVFEYGSELFVEEYNDFYNKAPGAPLKKIPSNEFSKHEINGISLRKIVDEKFKEIPYEN